MRIRAFYLLAALLLMSSALLMMGCSDYTGDVDANKPPEVDFVNVHEDIDNVPDSVMVDTLVYDFAPVIYWKGSDPDGFIEYYSYADVTDAAAIENPIEYITRIPQEAWKDTIATQATVKLLSEPGEITEHVFYLRAFDNEGAVSNVKYRRFYRSNNPPVIPRIGLTGSDETAFGTRYVVEDTLFSAPSITNVYPGIQFSWRGSDPDDKALFTIPLEYQAILVKAPAETIFVNPWTDAVEIQLVDLETGFYTLNVWARDDGLTKSVAPARAEFNVIRPTFENNLLVVLESPISPFIPQVNKPAREDVQQYFQDLLATVAPQVTNASLTMDGIDVRFYVADSPADVVPRSLISQYKVVVFSADHLSAVPWGTGSPDGPQGYQPEKQKVENDYLSVGGRVWQMGRSLENTGAWFDLMNNAEGATLLRDFFGVDSIAGQPEYQVIAVPVPQMRAEFIGTVPGLPNFPALNFDSTQASDNGFNFPGTDTASYYPGDFGLTGVARIQRSSDATTTQQFLSGTFGDERVVEDEDSYVLPTGTNSIDNRYRGIYYRPTATNAFVALKNDNVSEVSSVINYTRREEQGESSNYEGSVVTLSGSLILISYDEGDPWSNGDSLQVDYTYSPISAFHLKPVEVRVEGTQGGNQINPFSQLRFRTALSSFSYYFIEPEDAEEAWVEMLEWFFNPGLNDSQFDF